MELGHIHVQFPAVLRISRTVQWIREGARLDAPLPRRALEETAMTALFVKTFLCWLRDDSAGFQRTRDRLERFCVKKLFLWLRHHRNVSNLSTRRIGLNVTPYPEMTSARRFAFFLFSSDIKSFVPGFPRPT